MRNQGAMYFFLACLLTTSCKRTDNESIITSGRIDYKITYLQHHLDKKTIELMPRKMKLVFNHRQAANYIVGFMGFYELNAFTDFHSRTCSTLLKVWDKYYVFKGRRDEMMCCFDPMEDMKISETSETKTIAGFICKKVIVSIPSTHSSFDVYYTEDIDLRHPNVTNPYKKINGVLMEFELILSGVRMRLTADNYQPLPDKPFKDDLPEKMKEISSEQMIQLMSRLME